MITLFSGSLSHDGWKWADNRHGKCNKNLNSNQNQTAGILWLDNKRTQAWEPSEIYALFGAENDKAEKLWRDYFAEPSKCLDKRFGKRNRQIPGFKHKTTREVLWVENKCRPERVNSEIESLTGSDGERKWRDLFSSPSQWWDHRPRKKNPKFPDFIHKQGMGGLWLNRKRTPSWVASKVASLGPVTLQTDIITTAEKLSRYNKTGQFLKTKELFEQMQKAELDSDYYIFLNVLHAYAALGVLEDGRFIHRQIIESGWELHPYISNSLIDMYVKCGSLMDALTVFNKMPKRDVVCWNSLIVGYVRCGQAVEALQLFEDMQGVGIVPDSITFVAVLNACANLTAIEEGRRVHEQVVRSGCDNNLYVSNALIDMYCKCGFITDARVVFNEMPKRDIACWNAMILGSAKCGQGAEALDLFQDMQQAGVVPDSSTYVAVLNSCASIAALEKGRIVHNQVDRSTCESNVYVGNSLVDMYSKCGSIEDARAAFDKMSTRNVVAWTSMIVGYVKCGQGLAALELYEEMQRFGVEPDSSTFVALLNACTSLVSLEEGRRIHNQVVQSGCDCNSYVGSSLVDMYAKCGSLEDAKKVFYKMPIRDVVSWNAMILGFAMHGRGTEATSLFELMVQSGCEMNEVTFISLLSACSHGGFVKEGLEYFGRMESVYGVSPRQEHYTCIVDILGRASHLDDAEATIKGMPIEPSPEDWKSLLGACRVHNNLEMGERVAQELLRLDPESDAGYVLLGNICAAGGHFDRQKIVQSQRLNKQTLPGRI